MHQIIRSMLGSLLFGVALLGTCAPASAAASAKGLDAAARGFVGEHRLTLQWLDWDDLAHAGKVVIEDLGDTLSVSGEQLGQGDSLGGHLKIDGRIVSASKDGFIFVGDITTRAS